ncbi:SDR family NAD(P)-dependent oxidoreductase [Amycolatopsis sp. NPDC057786]|uniref:SDR family NAD(P)-dependent oxidoreductase n=1 Tax=Amycolatopsis sp. NPDC057786 TaxID=3346250 RepID=UPI00366D463F
MTTSQHKIGSGFGARSTAGEVLDGIDLSGKLAVVTGGYSGLGLETTRALANAGARVVVPARRPADAEAALAGISGTEVDELDLGEPASVEAFARRFLGTGRPIDLLIANAGIMAAPERRVGPGWESHFAICHLGHHALVSRLWPALKADGGARVVTVSSAGHHSSPMRWDDVQFERGYDRWLAYGQAKTANVLFAVQLDTLGAEHGIRAFSLHPGAILTPLQRYLRQEEMVERGWIDEHGELADPDFKTPEQGAATQVWAATSPLLDGMGGLYCEDCDIAELAPEEGEWVGVRPYAIDPGEAARLWKLSANVTGTSLG